MSSTDWGADCMVLLDLHRSSNRSELYYECVVYSLLYLSTCINTRLAHSCQLHLCNSDSRNTKLTDNCWVYLSVVLSTKLNLYFLLPKGFPHAQTYIQYSVWYRMLTHPKMFIVCNGLSWLMTILYPPLIWHKLCRTEYLISNLIGPVAFGRRSCMDLIPFLYNKQTHYCRLYICSPYWPIVSFQ